MWRFGLPTDIVFGENTVDQLSGLMAEHGLQDALLIAAPSSVKKGTAERLTAQGSILDTISEIEPNPTVDNVNACATKARDIGARSIVALGGGSSIDCAKLAAVCAVSGHDAREYLAGRKIENALPVVALPTTSGTGSEVTAVSVINWPEKKIKQPIKDRLLYPALAIVDPLLTHSCPAGVTAYAGLDVLAHALESLWSNHHQSATDVMALRASQLVFNNLEAAVLDGQDAAARSAMSEASVLAGMAFSQTGTAGPHACSYRLTLDFEMPHGEACAFTLSAFALINAQADRVRDFAGNSLPIHALLGFDSAQAMAQRINEMKRNFGCKVTLREAGIAESDFERMAAEAMQQGAMANNTVAMDETKLIELFRSLD